MTKTNLIGDFPFNPETGEMRSGRGQVTLRPQTSKVLALLAEKEGEVVSKQLLMERIWPDAFVTDDSVVQCISEIRKALNGQQGVQLTTVPRRGYRLDLEEEYKASETAFWVFRRQAMLFAALAVLLCIGFAVSAFWFTRTDETKPQITTAVLPFVNMSGDATQVYFSNGLAEDLIVSLSNISDLRVVSRGASFSIAQTDQDIRHIAEILQADFVLEGSVRRVGNSLRVSAALVDADTGVNVWAERFEGAPEDIFDFQDKVVQSMLRVLSVRLSESERKRAGVRGTRNIAAHDAYLRGRELENLYTRNTNLEAEEALLEALRQDPEFALAHAHLAQVYSFRVENNWTTTREKDIRAAFESAERAVTLDPDLPFAHFSLGRLYSRSFAPDPDLAEQAYLTAISLDSNYDDAYVFLANIYIFNGRAGEALPLISQALERNPVPPYWYYLADGMAHYFLKDYEVAESALVRARNQNPNAPYPYRFLIATYGQLGDIDEADWMAMEYEALGRSATVSDLLQSASIQDDGYRTDFVQGFRKAGLPEN